MPSPRTIIRGSFLNSLFGENGIQNGSSSPNTSALAFVISENSLRLDEYGSDLDIIRRSRPGQRQLGGAPAGGRPGARPGDRPDDQLSLHLRPDVFRMAAPGPDAATA